MKMRMEDPRRRVEREKKERHSFSASVPDK
jgi:hypothetical protein